MCCTVNKRQNGSDTSIYESAATRLTNDAKSDEMLAYGSEPPLPRSVMKRDAMPSVVTSSLTTLDGIDDGAAYRMTDCWEAGLLELNDRSDSLVKTKSDRRSSAVKERERGHLKSE